MRRLTTLGLGLTLTALTLTACGGDDESSGGKTYCQRIEAMQAQGDAFDELFTGTEPPSAEDTEKAFTTMQKALKAMGKGAPEEIAADVATMTKGMDDLVKALDENKWDFEAALTGPDAEKIGALLESSEMEAASDRLEKYSEETCGLKSES
jgi:hypothetical protein